MYLINIPNVRENGKEVVIFFYLFLDTLIHGVSSLYDFFLIKLFHLHNLEIL